MTKGKDLKKTVSFSIDSELLDEAKKIADEECRTLSNFLSFLIKKEVDKRKGK